MEGSPRRTRPDVRGGAEGAPAPFDPSGPPSGPAPRSRLGRAGDEEPSPPLGVSILLVEDHDEIRAHMAQLLAEDGYAVTSCANGQQALDLLRGGLRPSVIVLDLMMPVMDGWQFRVEQRRDPSLADLPVLVMSANDSPQARAIDAAAYIRKPVRVDALMAAIDRVVAREQARRVRDAERLALLGTLTAGVAHEIGNPLTYVLTNLELLGRRFARPPAPAEAADPEIPELLDEALEGVRRIAQLVRQIQTVARVARKEAPVAVDVRELVQASLRFVHHEIQHRARLVTSLAETAPVLGNRGRLEQVFINVLVNAAHACNDGSARDHQITVTTRTEERGCVVVEIADTGPGISPAIADRVFEPFFTTKPAGTGTGLGLSISRAIVEEANGTISFTSGPTGGTTFRIALPLHAGAVTLGDGDRRDDAQVPRPSDRLRILAVDDDPQVLRALRRQLEPQHALTVVGSADAALKRIEREDFDVVLCDLMMPEMDGRELLAAVQRLDPELAARSVFLTAGAFTERTRLVAEQARQPVVAKPFSQAELEGALAQVATGPRGPRSR